MSAEAEPKVSTHELKKAANLLYDIAHVMGVGEANRIGPKEWEVRYGRDRTSETARRYWERTKLALKVMDAPVVPQQDGREVYLVLESSARQFALDYLNRLKKYEPQRGRLDMIRGSRFLEVDLDDIEAPADYDPDPTALELMRASIRECPIGIINPVIIFGEAPPYRLGVGRLRYAACKAIGLAKIPARHVKTWHEIIRVDEDLVRKHYGEAECDDLRQLRVELIRQMKADGITNVQIAKELGISEPTVRRCSVSSDDETEHPRRVVRSDGKSYPAQLPEEAIEERRERVRGLLADGKSRREIAEILEVSPGTVQADIKNLRQAAEEEEEDDDDIDDALPQQIDEPNWSGIDPLTERPYVCLAAIREGLSQLRSKLNGSEHAEHAAQVLQLYDAVVKRIRSGDFAYEPAAQRRAS